MYKHLVRPLLFRLSSKDPEMAHECAIWLLHYLGSQHWLATTAAQIMTVQDPVDLLGLHFPNRVGLAAGFDKNAAAIWGLWSLGFGFLEVGTVTAQRQSGNSRPRIWRFPEDSALINAMGFNNNGADDVSQILRSSGRPPIPVGISIGKSRVVPPENLEAVIQDYLDSLKQLRPYGDYFVVNVSSPNTPGLRNLQDKLQLTQIVKALNNEAQKSKKVLLVKVSPDLSLEALDDILQVCADECIPGLIATNTTLSREGLNTHSNAAGGLSGRPLREKSFSVVRHIRRHSPNLVIIGVGGIMSVDDASLMIEVAGADLVQLYTGLVYEGPTLPRRIARGLKFAPMRTRG